MCTLAPQRGRSLETDTRLARTGPDHPRLAAEALFLSSQPVNRSTGRHQTPHRVPDYQCKAECKRVVILVHRLSASSGPSDEMLYNSSNVNFFFAYGWKSGCLQ